jgi:hypothetical protein
MMIIIIGCLMAALVIGRTAKGMRTPVGLWPAPKRFDRIVARHFVTPSFGQANWREKGLSFAGLGLSWRPSRPPGPGKPGLAEIQA